LAFGVVGDMQDLFSQISSQNSIMFHPLFSRFGQAHSYIWGPYAAEHEKA
jgi:hypothetical protein